MYLLLLLLLLLCNVGVVLGQGQDASSSSSSSSSSVRLRQGVVKGITREVSGRQIHAFLGIPYAKPPLQQLRFKPPQRHQGWNSPLYAKEFGPACPQPFLTGVQVSEDCLTLNVWIPEIPRGYRQYPVLVVIEGELFVTSAPSRFPAQDLTALDLIVVSLNYRTNAFGFLSWEDRTLPGNLGLRDQSLALQWVAENVDKFGGDPSKVTLLGHSAGAVAASYHLVHTAGQGSLLAPWALSRYPRQAAVRIGEHLGCGTVRSSSPLLRCLREKDAPQIVKAVERLIEEGNPYYLFGPVVDGGYLRPGESIVPVEPKQAVKLNANRRVPVLLTLAETDGSVVLYVKREICHMTYDDLRRYGGEVLVPLLTSLAGVAGLAVDRMVEYAYLDKAQTRDDLVLEIVKMFTDGVYKAPLVSLGEELSRRGLSTFLAVNSFVSRDIYGSHTNITGTLHGSEMGYLFSPTSHQTLFNLPLTHNEQRISQALKRMVYSFASTGQPFLGQYSPSWGRFSIESPTYASIESGQVHRGYQTHQVAFWSKLLPEMATYSSVTTTPDPTHTTTTVNPTSGPYVIRPGSAGGYESAVWVLVAVVLALLALIVAYVVCSRRRRRLHSGTLHGP
ncbi:hypothetical protein Pmani_037778 [Petrolisthes manimaculis]|uniref:Carboxylic ester hydrolase n=1 Tax=Petrolisthes manimaculis TaxID=1843537 RepID=A0AAE1TMY9_9EUCA|nr:hypothetical protein Pmani_037778 [Petrolisthes manimaculis]